MRKLPNRRFSPSDIPRSLKKHTLCASINALHGHFHLPWAGDIRFDHPLGIKVFHPYLFVETAVGHRFAGHAHCQRTAAGDDDHLVALVNHLWLFQRHRGNDLVDDHLSDNLLTDGLIKRGQKSLAQAAHVALTQRNVFFGNDGVAFQRAHHGHNVAIQQHLGRHKYCPGRRAFAAYPHRNPADRARAFQCGCQILVTGTHP